MILVKRDAPRSEGERNANLLEELRELAKAELLPEITAVRETDQSQDTKDYRDDT